MLAKSVFNDIQNNIIVNDSRSKYEKCILNTSRMVVWFETKLKKVSFPLKLSPDDDLLLCYSLPWRKPLVGSLSFNVMK